MRSSPKRIVIFGINYSPELTGIAPYTTELAEHFADQGWSVLVMTGIPHYPEWRRQPIPAANGLANPTVVRCQHFVPKRANAFGRMLYELTWLLSASRALTRGRPDAVIGIVPSLSGGLLATIGARRWRVPVGLIVQDLMGPAAYQSGYRGGEAVAGVTSRLEGAILRRANRVGIISEGFRPYLLSAGVPESKIQRLRGWTHPGAPTESPDICRSRLGWSSLDFVCLHAGNMGQKQGLDTLIEAAMLLRDQRVKIVLAGHGNDRERLVARAEHERLENVRFLDLQAPGHYEAMLRAADVLLLNQRASVAEMSLPSKLASYFASGRPVIAAVADASPAANEVHEAEAGIVVNPERPESLVEAILYLKANREVAVQMGRRGAAYAERNLAPESALKVYDDFLKTVAHETARIPSGVASA